MSKIRQIRLSLTQDIGLCLVLLFSTNCSDVRLGGMINKLPNAQGKGELCVTEPDEVKRWLKLLFVMDKSGSNGQTDPGADKRAGNIEKFLQANAGATNQQYGMIVFHDPGTSAYITEGSSPSFTPDLQVAMDAANRIRTDADGGGTPYKAALGLAKEAIRNDINKFPDEESFYMIFFVSDGEPTDIDSEQQLDELVTDLINLDSRNIALSTGFYGGRSQEFEDRLARMAKLGNGKFINFDKSQNWDFNDLIVRPTFEPWTMKYDLIVYNMNAGYCLDRSVDLDSDGDGLCDKDELSPDLRAQGFDPANRFSFNDGYSDYFHWRRVRLRQSLPPCQDRSDIDHDFLTACEEKFITNDTPTPGIPNHGDPLNPDTDKDGIIDGIETIVYMVSTMGYAMDSFNLQETFDGEEPARVQIQQHRSPLIRDRHQPAYDGSIVPISGRDNDCYRYSQTSLPLYTTLAVPAGKTLPGLEHGAAENVISVHYLQARQSDFKGDEIIFRYSLQKLVNDEATRRRIGTNQALRFDDSAFKAYKYGKRKRGN